MYDDIDAADATQQPIVFCNALKFLLARVNVMCIDSSNRLLASLQLVIRDHGISYESRHFDKAVSEGLGLERTEVSFAFSVFVVCTR